MTLVDRIKETAKNKRGWNLKTTAEKAGIGINSIYRWKEQTPTTDSLAKVAKVLDVSVDYLLGRPDAFELAQQQAEEYRKSEIEFGKTIDEEKSFLQAFVNDIVDLDKFDTLDYLYKTAKREKENIIREEKLETLIKNPKISNKKLNEVDPFERVHKQNAELKQKGLLPYRRKNTSQPDTLAAHQADPNHIITDDEADEIAKFLDDQIDRHEKK